MTAPPAAVRGLPFNAGMDPLARAVEGRPPLPPGPVLVVGLARSGVAAALALRARGIEAVGCDAGVVSDEARRTLETAGVAVWPRGDGVELLAGVRSVVKSPGVPAQAPVVAAARERGLPVVGEMELGWRIMPNPFIAVTGSNGKTTTVELIGHVHREAALPVAVAGNVGTALTSLADSLGPEPVVVCEASSFQLEDTEAFAPDAAVLLNVTEDHLDRHGTLEAYRLAKLRIFAHQPNEALAVAPLGFGVEDLGGCARRVCFGAGPGAELAERAGQLWWDEAPLMAVDEIRLRGAHNRANAMAAAAVCLARGIEPDAVRAGLASFGGVAHRLEEVATIDGVVYVNDSKATNVASAVVGISSFDGGVHAILGGRGKGSDYGPLAAPVKARCRAVHLIGEAGPEIGEALADTGVALHLDGDLEHAVAAARAAARPGEAVLLSPACASYDQYPSFEERGEHFRALITREAG
ncbi:MAG: UDP-N-acetylmuramoylalanine--D-glutamate ligase [uncultured Solirubrobacteraceae bacterium]|uniref:UDP-N-acetylmuramoylalanine--D-glutamate ligase n=1 Tax=uncultured Solirubrobacteraceae bacterium TaxID=1162706 RepID=A0A6J4RST5_9ACTN|nr:MAG: UDP-N-acetylmuramoylalanine--D-glutamate ligase [uncultured Solirubrobacteraceae bacterium]